MRRVFTGTYDWFQIVERRKEIVLADGTPPGWEESAEAAEIDPDDPESWVAEVKSVDERHSAIRPGDHVCCQGIGSDVIFVRFV